MYTPPHFAEENQDRINALIRANSFGVLVTGCDGELNANHIPFVFHPLEGEQGVLRAHVARANPIWKQLENGNKVLVIFQGEDFYVSPSWYASKAEHGKVVPTWNYLVVHVRGAVTIIEDTNWLAAQVDSLTRQHEEPLQNPWQVADAPADFIEAHRKGIVGLEIVIDEIKGKSKLSQNRSEADRLGVVNGVQKDAMKDTSWIDIMIDETSATESEPES